MVTEIPHLNDEEAERIEGEITLNEASVALRNIKHSKSPGTDGFNAEEKRRKKKKKRREK